MPGTSDFVVRRPPAGALAAAIDYAGRSLHFTYDRMRYGTTYGPRLARRLLRIAVGLAVERTFEAYLREQAATFDVRGRTHWREPDAAEFTVAGRRIDVKAYHVYPGRERVFPRWIEDAEGLVPTGQLKYQRAVDAYVQAFLVAARENTTADRHFVAVLPRDWSEPIQLPFSCQVATLPPKPIDGVVKVHGEAGEPLVDMTVPLAYGPGIEPRRTSPLRTIQFISAGAVQPATVKLAWHERTLTLHNEQFCDLGLADPLVYFAGWGTAADFRNGQFLATGSATRVYDRTRTSNYAVGVRQLRPLQTLLHPAESHVA